jgi:hypothetical protein
MSCRTSSAHILTGRVVVQNIANSRTKKLTYMVQERTSSGNSLIKLRIIAKLSTAMRVDAKRKRGGENE